MKRFRKLDYLNIYEIIRLLYMRWHIFLFIYINVLIQRIFLHKKNNFKVLKLNEDIISLVGTHLNFCLFLLYKKNV